MSMTDAAPRNMRYFIFTFGCQMNVHDSEKLTGMLADMGMTQAETREEADFILYNTCCVRDNAERKALGNVTWLKELKKINPRLIIGVCGCMIQRPGMAEKILKQYPFVDLAFGTHNLYRMPELLARVIESGERAIEVADESPEDHRLDETPVKRVSPHQAYITVMYGCNNFCSYCIVPYVRGRERSRAAHDILREAEALLKSGVQEIMLLGQNVNSYAGGVTFAALLHSLAELGVPRIRFMTSHPKDLSDELIDEIARNPSVCRHFHLPVQAGNDEILRRMNRRYTSEQYLRRVAALRAAVPDIGITTDIIVAFPGETDAQFEDTLSLVRTVRYDSAFTFVYSPRPGTRAAELPGLLPKDESTARIERLIAVQTDITKEVLASLVGTRCDVLVEGLSRRSDQMITGKCGRNISVNLAGTQADIGHVLPVEIIGCGVTTLRGRRVSEE